MQRPTPTSLWLDTAPAPSRPPLTGDLEVDVAVIGAGMLGVCVAALLKEQGARVALLEDDRVGAGVTGYTTAKVSSAHGLVYAKLASKHGAQAARVYGEANQGRARVRRALGQRVLDRLRLPPQARLHLRGAGRGGRRGRA